MKTKFRSMPAVEIQLPSNQPTRQTEQPTPEENLAFAPGGMALELVPAIQKALEPGNQANNIPIKAITDQRISTNNQLSISHAIRIKSAEYWLKLGEADQALKELEKLPSRSWNHGWALRTRIAAMGVLRGRKLGTVQE